MTKLEARARELAALWVDADYADALGDAIARLAREHAETAVYEFCDIFDASGSQRGEISEALRAAEDHPGSS